MAHGKWTEVEARAALKAWRPSGLSLAAFAEKRGIVPQRLYWWRAKLGDEDEDHVELLPVHVVEESKRGEPVLVMLRSGHIVKVGRWFDEAAFARVVTELRRMLTVAATTLVYLASEPVDVRKGFGGLCAMSTPPTTSTRCCPTAGSSAPLRSSASNSDTRLLRFTRRRRYRHPSSSGRLLLGDGREMALARHGLAGLPLADLRLARADALGEGGLRGRRPCGRPLPGGGLATF